MVDKITRPHASISDPQERRKAVTLSTALVAMIPVVLLSMVITLVIGVSIIPIGINFILLLCGYFTSRMRHFRVGGAIALFGFWITPVLMYLLDPRSPYHTTLLSGQWLVFSLLMAVLVMSARAMLIFSLVTVVSAIFFSFAGSFENSAVRALSLNLIVVFSGFAVMMSLIRREDLRERSLAEKTLRAREDHYRTIAQLMSDYAYSLRVDPDGRWVIEWVEGAWTAITGLTVDDIPTLVWKDYVHPDDLPELEARRANLMANKRDVRDLRITTKSGETRYIRDYGFPVWSESEGRTVRIIGAVQDITMQKQSEAAAIEQRRIAEEQRRLAEALRDTTAVLSTTLERDEVLERILDEVAKVIPSDAADIIVIEGNWLRVAQSRGYGAYVEQAEKARGLTFEMEHLRALHTMYLTGKPLVIEDTSSTDSDLWVEVEVSRWVRSYVGVPIILDGVTMGFLGLLGATPNRFSQGQADLLQAFADQAAVAIRNALLFEEVRRYADALGLLLEERSNELNFTRERLKAIVESSGDGIYYTEGTTIQYANPAFSELIGYSVEELVGKSITILRPDTITQEEAERRDNIPMEIARKGVWRGEVEMRRKNGDTFFAGVTASFIGGDDKDDPSLVRAVTIVRDITLETMVRQQQSRFVAHASHELRTPLTNFSTRLHLLRRDPARMEEHIAILDEVADQMRRLVSDLLDLTRFERGVIPLKMEVMLLQPLIEGIGRIQEPEAARKGITLRTVMHDHSLRVLIDQDRIRQVITNLLTNAINYTNPGGVIDLEVEHDGEYAVIRVRDSGIGIPADDLPFIFQPFYRVMSSSSKGDGAGLGLSIAKEIVEKHGGSLTVESEVNKGTTFTVRLKLAKETANESAAAPAPA